MLPKKRALLMLAVLLALEVAAGTVTRKEEEEEESALAATEALLSACAPQALSVPTRGLVVVLEDLSLVRRVGRRLVGRRTATATATAVPARTTDAGRFCANDSYQGPRIPRTYM